jgi:hypothetical protein
VVEAEVEKVGIQEGLDLPLLEGIMQMASRSKNWLKEGEYG